ncbi:hypothetical protein ACWD4J_04690 [Streptomyces sp. NPDC002577]
MTGMNDNDIARELLGRAVDDVPVPAGRGSEAVFARAARLRWRRRAAVTGVVAAAAAGGVLGSGVLPGGEPADVAASPTAGRLGTDASGFEKLLPAGVGTVRQVSLGQMMKGTKKPFGAKKVGPFDGEYTIARDGGVGFVTVHVNKKVQDLDPDPCTIGNVSPPVLKCTNEKVSGGTLLSIWQTPGEKGAQPGYSGTQLEARVVFKDGTVLNIRDWTGFLGQGSPGPVLKTFPLTRAQLRELALEPELLP